MKIFFPSLSNDHLYHTSRDFDNHYTKMMKLILQKYFALRIRKVLNDIHYQKRQDGNKIQRLRIFAGK